MRSEMQKNVVFFAFQSASLRQALDIKINMAKSRGLRNPVILEHKCEKGTYRYHTSKNRRNTIERLVLKKYSPVTKKHEIFKEVK